MATDYVRLADDRTVLRSSIHSLAVIAAAFVVAGLASSLGVSLTGVESLDALQKDPSTYAAVNGLGFVGFGLAGLAYVALRQERDLLRASVPSLRDVGWMIAGLGLLFVAGIAAVTALSIVVAVVETVVGTSVELGQNEIVRQGQETPRLFLYMIPIAIFLVGPAEEIVFRGVVQGLLVRAFGVVPGIGVASVLFGVGHYFAISVGSAWTYIFVATALGLVLGALYEHTDNLVVPAVVHGLWNAFLFAGQYYVAANPGVVPS